MARRHASLVNSFETVREDGKGGNKHYRRSKGPTVEIPPELYDKRD